MVQLMYIACSISGRNHDQSTMNDESQKMFKTVENIENKKMAAILQTTK